MSCVVLGLLQELTTVRNGLQYHVAGWGLSMWGGTGRHGVGDFLVLGGR